MSIRHCTIILLLSFVISTIGAAAKLFYHNDPVLNISVAISSILFIVAIAGLIRKGLQRR